MSLTITEIFSDETQLWNINNVCEGIFFEARPFPGNNQFYIGCVRGNGIILQCYENEYFDENQLRCVYNQPTTTIPIWTTSAPPNFDGICDGLEFNFISHPSDCGKAIFCFQQEPVIRECPPGQIFNINRER